MVCCVEQYIPHNDFPITEVELLLHRKGMVAIPRSLKGSKQFRPRRRMEFEVVMPFHDALTLKAYSNGFGEVHADLLWGGELLRKLHTHEGHRNPGGLPVPGTHMHFPTRRFPLTRGRGSYAYSLDEQIHSVSDGVWSICGLLGIEISGIQQLL